MGRSNAHDSSSTVIPAHQSHIDIHGCTDDEDEANSSSSSGLDGDEEVEQVPLGTKVPSAEDLGLGDAARRHISEMNFADAQSFLWKLSLMSEYDRKCFEVRLRVKKAIAAVEPTPPRKATNAGQAPHASSTQGRV